MNMWAPLLLLALTATPGAQGQQLPAACQTEESAAIRNAENRIYLEEQVELMADVVVEFKASIEKLENITNHLVQELDIVRSRQAASAAVQASQVIMMVTYFLTIICTWGLSRCQKVSEKAKRKEFERLEMQLRSSKARRRAAAAKEKSAQAQSLE